MSSWTTTQTNSSSLGLMQQAQAQAQAQAQSPVMLRQYLFMPVLFFIIMLATWVVPTINRVMAFVKPDVQSYGLMLAVGAMGSLRGFWNGVLFIAIGLKGWKRQRDLNKILLRSKVRSAQDRIRRLSLSHARSRYSQLLGTHGSLV